MVPDGHGGVRGTMTGNGLYLGADGGGTKTEFVCMDAQGQVVARAVTGTTYHLQVGLAGAVQAVRAGVAAICAELAIAPSAFSHVFLGLPAYGEDAQIDPQLHAACGQLLGHDRYACDNDMVCGWAGSLGCADGINLVAGTGSIAYGQRHGQAARAGGWGEIFGDEGSAYWIAIQGLNAFTRMSDGRLPKGALHDQFRAALALDEDLDLCARIMGDAGLPRDEIAALARLVSAAAAQGDPAAAAILHQAARELMLLATALRASLGYQPGEPAALSWSGGVLGGAAAVLQALRALAEADGGFRLVTPRHTPGEGAALYARHLDQNRGRSPRP